MSTSFQPSVTFAASCSVQMCFPCQEQTLPEGVLLCRHLNPPKTRIQEIKSLLLAGSGPPQIAEWEAQGGRDVNKQSLDRP